MAFAGHGFHCDGNVGKFCLFSFLRKKRFFMQIYLNRRENFIKYSAFKYLSNKILLTN